MIACERLPTILVHWKKSPKSGVQVSWNLKAWKKFSINIKFINLPAKAAIIYLLLFQWRTTMVLLLLLLLLPLQRCIGAVAASACSLLYLNTLRVATSRVGWRGTSFASTTHSCFGAQTACQSRLSRGKHSRPGGPPRRPLSFPFPFPSPTRRPHVPHLLSALRLRHTDSDFGVAAVGIKKRMHGAKIQNKKKTKSSELAKPPSWVSLTTGTCNQPPPYPPMCPTPHHSAGYPLS